jgi:hypothetical protein
MVEYLADRDMARALNAPIGGASSSESPTTGIRRLSQSASREIGQNRTLARYGSNV